MIPILSQLDKIEPGFLRDWLVVLAAMVGLVVGVGLVVDRFRAKRASAMIVTPDPLQVREVKELATKAEMETLGKRLEGDIEGIRVEMRADRLAATGETRNTHHRIDALAETLAETKGLLQGVKHNTDQLLAKLMK
jgi:hypothetical protein